MKKEHTKEIFEKYKNGLTSLEEERFLLKNASINFNFPLLDWIKFEKKNKKQITDDFNERLWQSFEKKTQPKTRLLKRVVIAAASIVLLFTLYNKNKQENTQSLWEKEALLMEAKSMFSDIEQNANREIIFDSDLVTVYATKE
ncbi:hypothetical protein [Winogradskyella schleiferi]|uniref:hypothetical protein n=1 Tax=Winogradskyella schleiferi TaxID=2686078 RepID=UPI0015C18FC8|nr:hypothetical protein [Winogradskyella schleiferi]